jgi:hypothetical protein
MGSFFDNGRRKTLNNSRVRANNKDKKLIWESYRQLNSSFTPQGDPRGDWPEPTDDDWDECDTSNFEDGEWNHPDDLLIFAKDCGIEWLAEEGEEVAEQTDSITADEVLRIFGYPVADAVDNAERDTLWNQILAAWREAHGTEQDSFATKDTPSTAAETNVVDSDNMRENTRFPKAEKEHEASIERKLANNEGDPVLTDDGGAGQPRPGVLQLAHEVNIPTWAPGHKSVYSYKGYRIDVAEMEMDDEGYKRSTIDIWINKDDYDYPDGRDQSPIEWSVNVIDEMESKFHDSKEDVTQAQAQAMDPSYSGEDIEPWFQPGVWPFNKKD